MAAESGQATARKFPCPACGAKLDFNPHEQALKCPYCGHLEAIEAGDPDKIEEHDFDAFVERLSSEETVIVGRSQEVRCTGCGAIVMLEDKIATDKCPFCATHLESQPKPAHAIVPPESVLPFKIDDRKARGLFNQWISSLWFAPTELKQLANLGQLAGVYLPYWTYDSMTYNQYRGQRGDDYTDTEYYTTTDAQGNTVTRSRTVVRTAWTNVGGNVEHFFDDVLIYASKGLPEDKVNQLTPWDLEQLNPFKAEFLSGFKTERYSIDLQEGFGKARDVMDAHIRILCMQDIGGDHQVVDHVNTQHKGVTFKHLLLPIWLAAYRYHDKLFRIMVNARTGEVVGDRPYSVAKIVSMVLAILLAIAMIATGVALMKKGGGRSFGMAPPTPAHAKTQNVPVPETNNVQLLSRFSQHMRT